MQGVIGSSHTLVVLLFIQCTRHFWCSHTRLYAESFETFCCTFL